MRNRNFVFTGLLGVLAITLCTSSCRKVETEPRDWFGAELVFDTLDRTGSLAGWNLNDIYNYLPGGFNRVGGDFLDAATDDAVPSRNNTNVEFYTNGRINVLNNPDPYWGNSYYGIRRATNFIKNIDVVPLSINVGGTFIPDTLTKRYWKAEARFIRSMLYFELVKRYGGVPLLGDTLFTLNDDLQVPRNTFAQCVEYIVNECNAVKDSLRPDNVPDAMWGRIPKGAAVALKCRVLLYAASPLFNGGGFETDPVKKALTGYPTADPSRWQRVIAAAEELRALNYYNLLSSGTPTAFASVFTTKKNVEIILAKQSPNSTGLETSQSPVGYTPAGSTSQGLTSPTQNFVNAFPTSKGGYITEDLRTPTNTTGYDSTNPYANRDPRLAVTVFYNGLQWLARPVETFDGGRDKPNNTALASVQTKTGYYLRKFLGNFATGSAYSNQSHNFPIFRYAEILLNYAEALNEVGRVEDAVNQIKLIRARAGITAGTNTRYGIKTGITQVEMAELIRNERRIELAFEEHRFWDLRRWKLAPQALNTTLYGMQITRNGTALTYRTVPVKIITFQQRLYHMPLPYDETTKNLALIQNEGW